MTAFSASSFVQRFTHSKLEFQWWQSKIIMAYDIFTRATLSAADDLNLYEEILQDCVFHCRDRYLRGGAGGRPTLVLEDGQKLPYE
jgi:hypothetical protein